MAGAAPYGQLRQPDVVLFMAQRDAASGGLGRLVAADMIGMGGSGSGVGLPSAPVFAPHEMEDATELTVGVSSAGFEFDCGSSRYLP
jgi:hypothetical protein